MNSDLDPLDLLRDLRPDTAALEREWPAEERLALRRQVVADSGASPFRFRPRTAGRTLRRAALPAAAAAVAALIAGVLVITLTGTGGEHDSPLPVGRPFRASTVVATADVGKGQYAYRATTSYELHNGKLTATERSETWTDPGGAVWGVNTPGSACFHRRHTGDADFGNPTQAFVAALPTDPTALNTYLREHVDGSTSREEAIFVATGDLLRAADLLASSTLRAAFVTVLSRTGGVAVHTDATDSLGRTAVRVDFVDPNNRPGVISSLYFKPRTFQLVEETDSKTVPTPYRSQSYDDSPARPTTPVTLARPTNSVVVTSEGVVSALPSRVANCH